MTDTLRDQIAAAVSLHEVYAVTEQDEMNAVLPPSRWKCECGDEGPLPPFEKHKAEEAVWQTNAEHLADAILAVPGIAVVELPEPDEGRDDAWYDSAVHLGQPNYVAMPRTVFVELEPGEPIPLSPGVARLVAAALLVAADYAERDQ